jgi:hypothetical protein
MLGEPAKGRDFPAEHRPQQRLTLGRVDVEDVFAGDRGSVACRIVVERTDAGVGPHDIGRRHGTDDPPVDAVLDQAHMFAAVHMRPAGQNFADPWSGGIHQSSRVQFLPLARGYALDGCMP